MTVPPVYTAADYALQFQRLLPRGQVWHRGLGMVQDADILTLMPTWSRLGLRLNDLITQIFPCSTTELLPEWEESLGLPDPCVGALATIQERQQAVCAKFTARGGQSAEYYVNIAAALGFAITITEFAPFRVGINRAGDPLNGFAWAHTWCINVAETTIVYFRAGISRTVEALREWGNQLLECMMNAIKPAHTVLQFSYGAVTAPVTTVPVLGVGPDQVLSLGPGQVLQTGPATVEQPT